MRRSGVRSSSTPPAFPPCSVTERALHRPPRSRCLPRRIAPGGAALRGEGGMAGKLRVLLVEDSEDDAALVLAELKRAGYAPVSERVYSAAALEAALA